MYPIQIPPLERGIVCIVNIYLIYGVITYSIILFYDWDSNPGLPSHKSGALPTELPYYKTHYKL